jgi:hypothetical protein
MVAAAIRTAFVQEDQTQARSQSRETADTLRARFPRLSALMDAAEESVLAFMGFPKEHWPQSSSTNSLKLLNKVIKRRSRVVGIFPNNASIVRLVGTLLAGQTDPAKAVAGRLGPSLAGVAATRGPKRRQGLCRVRDRASLGGRSRRPSQLPIGEGSMCVVDMRDDVAPPASKAVCHAWKAVVGT